MIKYFALINAVCVVIAFSIFALVALEEPDEFVLNDAYAPGVKGLD